MGHSSETTGTLANPLTYSEGGREGGLSLQSQMNFEDFFLLHYILWGLRLTHVQKAFFFFAVVVTNKVPYVSGQVKAL